MILLRPAMRRTAAHRAPVSPSIPGGALLLAALLVASLLTACGGAPAEDDGTLRVVATTNLVADTARRLAGDAIEVEALMGPGVDPHLYKASESDVRRLAEADLILYNGLHLEGKMTDILVKMARGRAVVALAEGIPEEALREPPEFAGQYDPHVWFDVALWAGTLEPVADALVALAPEREGEIRQRAEAYRRELEELDGWVRSRVETIPPEQRVLVTAHDAFGYFGAAYGVEVVGIQGISTVSEAGLQDVDRVVELVAERRIPALFVESSVPRQTVEAVQAAVRDRGFEVTIGGELHSDSLGAADGPAGTYPGMIRENVDTLVSALAGAPPSGPGAEGAP